MPTRRLIVAIADTVLAISGLVGIVVPLAHFTGLLEHAPWLVERIPQITLIIVSLVLIDVVVERRLGLETVLENLSILRTSHETGVRYLPNADVAETALAEFACRAKQSILAIGAKSMRSKYLTAVEEAVKTQRLTYQRLLEGFYITHEVHQHLSHVIGLPNVQIRWTSQDKYANLLITESDTVVAFPSPWKDRYSALALPGHEFAHQYAQYFFDVFGPATTVSNNESLAALCIDCGMPTDRTPGRNSLYADAAYICFMSNEGVNCWGRDRYDLMCADFARPHRGLLPSYSPGVQWRRF